MLFYNFEGYAGFQARFGMQEHGNGEKSRKNKILLSYIKNKDLLHEAVANNDYSLLNISSMTALKQTMLTMVSESGLVDDSLEYKVNLMGHTFYSAKYETDGFMGLCEDCDSHAVRYINHDNDKVYKMKVGKILRALILETAFGQTIPEQVLTFILEEFSAEWQTYAARTLPEHRLVVDEKFWKIYDSDELEGDFGSCMVDKDFHSFYKDAVNAKAAYLLNDEDKIVARCIIFTEVFEEDSSKTWRLAERQYSSGGSDVLKRALIDALIRAGEIDGYKKVGAGCGDSREFVDINGNSLAEKKFWIQCCLGMDDPLSYQDSFKWYNYNQEQAYNHNEGSWDYELDTTDGSLDGCEESEYDDYHGYSCQETVCVYQDGCEYYCDVNNLDDFIYVDGDYHHKDDCSRCENCDEWYLDNEGYYSEMTDAYYCCKRCRDLAEDEWKENHWTYSEYDEGYYEKEDDVVSFWQWDGQIQDYREITIYVGTVIDLLRNRKLFVYDGEVYDKLRRGKPMRLAA